MLSELALSFVVVRLSHPIKSYYASVHNLDLDALLSSSPYKEAYRREMVALAESQMKKDPHVFARQALENSLAQFGCCSQASTPDVILVSDARRPSDMDFFTEVCGRTNCIFIRITATEQVRVARGWQYTESIDDATTECGLDAFSDWDCRVENNLSGDGHMKLLDQLTECIYRILRQ
ncbi:phosphomevalonate kinase [Clonorchis sinensis]|uniref:Phosphomevalonate kinase n=1 Tax=Clonorchis sinensis TaxID=79923 RepID=H2KU40_CLOSI|nr:phosphomevalonate kinase [Clonorchis sinensis]